MNPRSVNCADFTPPPTVGLPSSTTQRQPAFARYAAVTRLLCPAPATTISKRSGAVVCRAMVLSGDNAKGASAAPFTNPRRVIPLMPCLLQRIDFRWGETVSSDAKLVAQKNFCQRELAHPVSGRILKQMIKKRMIKLFRSKLNWRMIAPQISDRNAINIFPCGGHHAFGTLHRGSDHLARTSGGTR